MSHKVSRAQYSQAQSHQEEKEVTPKELAEQIRASVFEAAYHAESKQWIIGLLSTEMEKQVAAALAGVDAQARREERVKRERDESGILLAETCSQLAEVRSARESR